jgi:hypothetical protein
MLILASKFVLSPVLLSTEHYAMKAYWESGGIAPRTLDLGITFG